MYVVIVCPVCRSHCQISETGKKTTKCQRCGAVIRMETVRVLGRFESRTDAVTLRSALQAGVSGPIGPDDFLLRGDGRTAAENDSPADGEKKGRSLITVRIPEKPADKKPPKANDVICAVLAGGAMTVDECRRACAERGLDTETFEKMTGRLIEAGRLYRPVRGYLALVP